MALWQRLNSAVVARKQPQATPKWMGMSVFQSNVIIIILQKQAAGYNLPTLGLDIGKSPIQPDYLGTPASFI